ncbi:MAG TPA: YCF48-related protein, partial [Gammaproteobacteria bacterium]|nr:YCF48-related protein [Gammaproteobacteria bacterium]
PVGLCALALAATPAWTQAPAALKGVWEPVNYTEDLELTDVFFVTPEIGYVGGAAGTILKTTDAGETWTPLLGGDPLSQERAVTQLWFVSPTIGWAAQASSQTNLFRTRDGETWEQIGIIDEHYEDFAFSSETEGVFVNDNLIYRTQDGGKTWEKVNQCVAKAMIDGLARQVNCRLNKVRFVSSTVVYAFGGVYPGSAALVTKSVDGGASWSVVSLVENESGTEGGLFFVDESTGYFTTTYDKAAFRTLDGGQTWTGIPATSIPGRISFADPEVGWAMGSCTIGAGCANAMLSYTVDGGRRWASRSFALPAPVSAFSLPRRDVAYAVGDHGMIYRYRVVPTGTPVAANAIEAIAMPPLANDVIEQLAELEIGLDGIEAAIEAADSAQFADTAAAGDAAATGWFEANVPEFSEFEATIDTVAAGLPEIGRKHRNLNLLLQGLQLLGDLTGQGSGVKEAFVSLRQAKDLNSVSAALLGLHSQLDAAKTSVTAFESSPVSGP